jgi:hypothetical protein
LKLAVAGAKSEVRADGKTESKVESLAG